MTEPVTEPATEPETEPGTEPTAALQWVKGFKVTHRYGQPATFTASNRGAYAIVDFDPDADYVLTLLRYDRYTQARILFPDAEGKVIGWTVTTYGGDTVHVLGAEP